MAAALPIFVTRSVGVADQSGLVDLDPERCAQRRWSGQMLADLEKQFL